MREEIVFKAREEFRQWLSENALSTDGLWLVFGKKGGPKTLSAGEALEEALCFGWIDGQMESIDETYYIKYFKQRGKSSNWSEKNRKLAEKLEAEGLMTDFGRAKIAEAKKSGAWDAPKRESVTAQQMSLFEDMLKPHGDAYENFVKMPKSQRETYAASYFFGAKTESGKQKRLITIIERLKLNMNPMESMKKKNSV